jgi:hypothetical protein
MVKRTLGLTIAALGVVVSPACTQDSGSSDVDSTLVALRLGAGSQWKTDFSRISVPVEEIVSGGPPKDGIPSIDEPRFEDAKRATEWLESSDPVMVVEHGGEVKGYPLRILIWHEIVNDEVGGKPLSITFCPLCNTALTFERDVAGRILDFGTTGRLRHSDLVMYDRQTETWWQQASGEAIVGELLGMVLTLYPANTLAWGTARVLHPGIRVLSRDTGHNRDYGRNPYAGYDTRDEPLPNFFRAARDGRLPAMERIVALELGDGWAAPFSALSTARVANDEEDGTPFAVFWSGGAASALDRARIPDGRDVGQTAVFDRRLADRTLTFQWQGGAFRDLETSSEWDLAGRAVSGPLQGERLASIPHGNHFWFAWVVFRAETRVWSPSD